MTHKLRRVIASAGSLAIAVRLGLDVLPETRHLAERLFFGGTVALPVIAAALVWIDRIGAQLLARGAWWSMLLLGALGAIAGRGDASFGAYIAACAGGSLLASGGAGLASRGRFAPVAFRGTLLLSLVLAIADTGAITWFGLGEATFDHRYWIWWIAIPMAIGVIGLLQLRTWGLIVNALTNVAMIALVATRTLLLPEPLRELFIGSAIAQLAIPVPMLITILRGRTPDPNAWRRLRIVAPIAIVLAIVGFSCWAAFACHGRLFV